MFPDVGNNAAVISLQNGPVVEGDVKVMFESSAVSAFSAYIEWFHFDVRLSCHAVSVHMSF